MCVLERMFDIKTKRRETRKTTRRNRMRSFDNWKMKIVFSFLKFCFIVVAFCTNIPKSIKFYSIDNCSWNVEDTLAGNTHTHTPMSVVLHFNIMQVTHAIYISFYRGIAYFTMFSVNVSVLQILCNHRICWRCHCIVFVTAVLFLQTSSKSKHVNEIERFRIATEDCHPNTTITRHRHEHVEWWIAIHIIEMPEIQYTYTQTRRLTQLI